MFAGRMKLKHFLAMGGVGAAGVTGGGLYATGAFEDRPPQVESTGISAPTEHGTHGAVDVGTPVASHGQPVEGEASKVLDGPPQPVADGGAVELSPPDAEPAFDASRPWDPFLFGKSGSALGSKKIKDAKKGAWKVNLYQDEGEAVMNRAKVDIDRDDKWDEKWTFSADGISRKVAPADDEDYSESYFWDGEAWQAL